MPKPTTGRHIVLLPITLVFLAPRLLAISQPYYQDDAKIPLIIDPAFGRQGANPHPPLGEALQAAFGVVAGYDHLRWLPFLFSLGNLLLVFRLAKRWGGPSAGRWAAFMLAGTFYSVLSSTMLDVDGAIMPFFGLLALGFYSKGRDPSAHPAWRSQIPTAIACATGLLLKFIFLLLPAALVLDAWLKAPNLDRKRVTSILLPIAAGAVWLLAGLGLLKLVYGGSDVTHAVSFARGFDFFVFDRASVSHKLFEFSKCMLYASPWILICVPALPALWKSARPALLFILLYLVVHSLVLRLEGRAIDRYFGMLVPFAAVLMGISASTLVRRLSLKSILISLTLAPIPLLFLVPSGTIIPFYPKTGIVSALTHGDWTTLIPFRGGNGPAGFYVPIGLVVLCWALAAAALLVHASVRSDGTRRICLTAILALGSGYNLVFAEEHALGLRYGNPSRLASRVLSDVTRMSDIPRVITYDDIGLYELTKSGQYAGRFYGLPEYWKSNRGKFQAASDSKILVVHYPLLDPNGPYWRYLSGCRRLREWRDGRIEAFLADCAGVPLP